MSERDVDLAHLPRGQKGLRELVAKVSRVHDTSERNFFEVKSDVDLTTKVGRAKLAKFVLGAANRDPAMAARRFDGHALLILGVESGDFQGIPPFEAHEVQGDVAKFTGVLGPEWDFDQLVAADGRSVFVAYVMPPDPAKQPWVCQADFTDEKMTSGGIYLRADGETRPARAAEVEAMLARRAAATVPQADIEVAVQGKAHRYNYDQHVVDDYIARVRDDLLAALPKPKSPMDAMNPVSPALELMVGLAESKALGWGMTKPEDRTEQQYRAQIDAWATAVREQLPAVVEEAVASALPGVTLRIRRTAGTSLNRSSIYTSRAKSKAWIR